MNDPRIPPEIRSEIESIALDSGCWLEHTEFSGGTLRIILDSRAGITLDHCQTVSKQVSSLLDIHEFGQGRYLLEVSSPGLDRQLRRPEDYERFQGSLVRVTWKANDMTTKKTVVAKLESYKPDPEGSLKLIEAAAQQRYTIYLKDLESVRLEPEL